MKGQTDAPFFSQLTVPIQVSQNLGCNVPPLTMQSHVVLVLNSLMTCVMSCLVLKPFSWDREGQHASQNHMFFYVVSRFNPTMCHQMTHFWRDQTMQIYKYMINWQEFPFVHCLAWCHFFWEHLCCSTRWRICEHKYFEFSALVTSRCDLCWNARKKNGNLFLFRDH